MVMENTEYCKPLAGTSRQVEVEQRDEVFPFAAISQEDLLSLLSTSGKLVAGEDGSLYLQLRAPTRGSLTPRTTKPRRRKRLQSQSPPTPSTPRRNSSYHSYTTLPLPPPAQPAQPPAYYSQSRFSPLSFIFSICSPGLPLVIIVVFASIAIMSLSNLLCPLTMSLGHVVDNIANINPAETIHAIVAPAAAAIGAIPVKDMWCGSIGFGCEGPDRNAPFTTDSFHSLDLAHPAHEISLGNDFFDCLSDLRITREQDKAVSHLLTLASKVKQFGHVLDAPEELSDNVLALARARRDVIMHANAARVTGSGGVGKIISEFENARFMSTHRVSREQIQKEVISGLSSAQRSLQETAEYTVSSSQALKSADELSVIVAEQAHREISRLRRINNDLEQGLKYLAYGWTEPTWKYLQPGLKGTKDDRIMAGEFLKELVRVVDLTAQTLLVNSMSLQQCAVNTKNFNEQVERAFSFDRLQLSLDAQIRHLVPRIESLGAGLTEMKNRDEVLRLGGPATTSPTSPPTLAAGPAQAPSQP